MKNNSAIIYAYNKEKTIKDVILSVYQSEIFDEIVIVNDGSKDKTSEVLNEISDEAIFKNIPLSENKGKGYAMSIGIENAKNEIFKIWSRNTYQSLLSVGRQKGKIYNVRQIKTSYKI